MMIVTVTSRAHASDSWLLVTESDVDGRYGASRITLDGSSRTFRLTLRDAVTTTARQATASWSTSTAAPSRAAWNAPGHT